MAGPAVILGKFIACRNHAQDLQNSVNNAATAQGEANLRRPAGRKSSHRAGRHQETQGVDPRKEVSVKAALATIKKHEQQLNDITSKKEYDALKVEIADAKQRIAKLEDEGAGPDDRSGRTSTPVADAGGGGQKSEGGIHGFERDYQSRLDDWTKQRDVVVKQVAVAETELPKDVRPQYDRVVKTRGADALSPVVGGFCTACHTEITAQAFNNLRMQQFMFCRSCGVCFIAKKMVNSTA